MVHQKHKPDRKPAACPGAAHDGFMDGAGIGYRYPPGNLPSAMGLAAHTIFAGTGAPDLFLCTEDNPPGV